MLRDTNHMVRIKTTEVLSIMATHTVGRWATVYGNLGQGFFFFFQWKNKKPGIRDLYIPFEQCILTPNTKG